MAKKPAHISELEMDKFNSNGRHEVLVSDQTTPTVAVFACRLLNETLLAVALNIDDQSVTLGAGHGAAAGNLLCLKEGARFYQSRIITVVDDVITVAAPLDYAFTTAAEARVMSNKMNVNGSVTPVIFSISPPPLSDWHINGVSIMMTDASPMDSSKFGGLPALPKGMIFRHANGTNHNITEIHDNAGFRAAAFDVEYDPRAPAGVYGFSAVKSFNGKEALGVAFKLVAEEDDEMQIIVQDDLTGLLSCVAVWRGHETEE